MSYLWQDFNIKTYPAETLIFRDRVFFDDLSEYKNIEFNKTKNLISINKTPKLPVHIIYIGEIAGNIELNIYISSENTDVFMDFKVFCKKPAFLNIFIKNTGKNSVFNGKIIIKNQNDIKINVNCVQNAENTGVFVKTKVAAYKNSKNYMYGAAKIEKTATNAESDISFSCISDTKAIITMKPVQYINSEPKNATHSASIYKPSDNQIYYLKTSGMSDREIKDVLEAAFLEE